MTRAAVGAKGASGGLVYSTEGGRMCPQCRRPMASCNCRERALADAVPAPGRVRVSRQSKGRGGKTVTLVTGLPLAADALAALGKELRAACGSGGTVKDGVVEVQGDHVDRLTQLLRQRGLR